MELCVHAGEQHTWCGRDATDKCVCTRVCVQACAGVSDAQGRDWPRNCFADPGLRLCAQEDPVRPRGPGVAVNQQVSGGSEGDPEGPTGWAPRGCCA